MAAKQSKNLLPLLAVTALMLSVGLANFTQISDSKIVNTQSVLSKSDEKEDENEIENTGKEKEKDKQMVRERIENKNEVKKEEKKEISNEDQELDDDISLDVKEIKLKIEDKDKNNKFDDVKIQPEVALQNVLDEGEIDDNISIDIKNDNEKSEYQIEGVEKKKFLGIFNMSLPKTVTIDAITGEVATSKQNVWSRFLNFLSR